MCIRDSSCTVRQLRLTTHILSRLRTSVVYFEWYLPGLSERGTLRQQCDKPFNHKEIKYRKILISWQVGQGVYPIGSPPISCKIIISIYGSPKGKSPFPSLDLFVLACNHKCHTFCLKTKLSGGSLPLLLVRRVTLWPKSPCLAMQMVQNCLRVGKLYGYSILHAESHNSVCNR